MFREQIERNLIFLGFIVLENRLKPETESVIHELKVANIKTVMVTGDNMLTALSVARESGMISDSQKVILVQAYSNKSSDAYVEYIYNDALSGSTKEASWIKASNILQELYFCVSYWICKGGNRGSVGMV